MCGFAGFLDPREGDRDVRLHLLSAMADTLVHRGPDDEGTWTDPEVGIGLAFRRLSILDLSPEGHQPMASADGRYVMVFNGEIYNHLELRQDLASRGDTFRGHSDTEVMLAAFVRWGVMDAVKRFQGMFAIALWDRQARVLHLLRDRVGKKPLYVGWQSGVLLFGSELKALRRHPAFEARIDRLALGGYFQHSYVPGPRSIYVGIQKLPPGTCASIPLGAPPGDLTPQAYWLAESLIREASCCPFQGSEREAVGAVRQLLLQAVGDRMVADVPVGAFLSGGIDSSLVVSLMQAQSRHKVRTFSIGFDEAEYNEAHFARAVADHLGTDHTELYVQPAEALAVVPDLPAVYDEPFSDSSQIPTLLVSRLARQQVTVALSGDGGDELFGGYNRYFQGQKIWNSIRLLPIAVRKTLGWCLTRITPAHWDRMLKAVQKRGGHLPGGLTGDRIHKLAGVLGVDGLDSMYARLVSYWDPPMGVVLGMDLEPSTWKPLDGGIHLQNPVLRMMYLDLVTYLVDDILVKVDRASMATSLEVRAPLLDQRLLAFAWSLPMSMKVRGGEGKWILRELLSEWVPRHFTDRPKMGFGVPIDSWLRGPLRGWAEDLLDPARLRREGFLDPAPIQLKWQEHLSGRRNWQHHLWGVLMFESWLGQQTHKEAA